MPKRPYPEDDDNQPIKKQQNSKTKSRNIRSSSSERTLQLLYEGAAKLDYYLETKKEQSKVVCTGCSKPMAGTISCNYCEHDVCCDCKNTCYKCCNEFCSKCSFLTYDQNEAVCYTCCTY
ncbi:uncharacterized protein LOC135141762 [Zophobas morio]|uniref:uncharacterized protein LOC135141762 n=1 Tax=Zophobas morio TaxID=2755281 RepID=UPI003082FBF2